MSLRIGADVTSAPLGFHSDFASMTLPNHLVSFWFTWMSLRFHSKLTPNSLRVSFGRTSTSLGSTSASLRAHLDFQTHFGFTFTSLSFHFESNELRFHFEFDSISLQYHFSASLGRHFDCTPMSLRCDVNVS